MKFSELNLHDIGNTIGMIGVIYQGNDQTLFCTFPGETGLSAEYEHVPGLNFLEMTLEEWKLFLHQVDVHETEVLAKASDGTICKAILRKSQRHIAQDISWKVFKRDGYKCRYCGRDNRPLTVDHLVTWEEGGPSIEENLVSCCRKCNKTRGNTPYEEWLNSSRYSEVSNDLPVQDVGKNIALVHTLASIPRRLHQVSR